MPIFSSLYRQLRHSGLGLFFLFMASTARGEVALLDHYHRLKHGFSATLPGTDLNVSSSELDDVLSAEVNSILPTPFEEVVAALTQASNWCEVMPLHFNIKACTHESQDDAELLTIYSGRKIYESPDDSYQMTYQFEVIRRDDSQFSLRLHADDGPMSTSDYLIELNALAVPEGTLLHIHSSYRPSWLSTMLTGTYLSTVGRNKVGFSQVEQDGESHPVQGIRGIIERNVMRYQLAINSFFSSQSQPENTRQEAMLLSWFKQNDSYPRQLHEMDKSEYLEIKHRERENQRRLQRALDEDLQVAAAPFAEDE